MKRDLDPCPPSDESADVMMTPQERNAASLLIVEALPESRQKLRGVLQSLGFSSLAFAKDHSLALEMVLQQNFSHCLFSATHQTMPVVDFVKTLMDYDARTIAIAMSNDPAVDDVFEMLRIGARGFLVVPYNVDSVDKAILYATKGEPFSDVILQARDRNEAFAAMLAAGIDRAAVAARQSRSFSTAERDLAKHLLALESSAQMSRTFAEGGDEELLESIVEFFTNLADGPATRLGRLRKRLNRQRVVEEEQTTNS